LDSKISKREQWTSKLGFILAAAGSAVGLGNLWGFAYRSSQDGGAAFVLLYLLIVLIVCLPVFVAEMALGRNAMKSALLAPVELAGTNWYPLGILFFIAPIGILSFYSVIMGWTADTFFHSFFFGLPNDINEAETFFGSISSGSSVLLGHLLSILLTAIIVSSGIKKGIEKVTRYFMPILFIILLILAIWAASLSGAWEGYKTFLLKFDFAELKNPQTIRNAFSQAFFSLSLGIGIMVAYASYLNKKSNIPKLSIGVASLDTLVGLMAGLITFPIVLTFGLSDAIKASTISTLFVSIPTGLGASGVAGRIVAIAFFGLVYIAAITSSVSLLEVPVSSLMDKFGYQRGKSVWLITIFVFILGIPSALNGRVLETFISVTDILLIFGGFLVTFFMGWVVPRKLDSELKASKVGMKTTRYFKFMMRWISPPIIAFGLVISFFDLL
tara:strand:+ start:86 stop:1411 length:1326 start_codon:yes stop_codon:yes gene_type:complete